MIIRYVLAWFGLMVIAIANGTIRQFTYGQVIPELHAHQLSTLTGITLMGLYIWWITRKWKLKSAGQAWAVGFIWLVMTILFEFIFGHYAIGKSWATLLNDYNLLQGRVWIFVPIWATIAPYIFFRIRYTPAK